MVDVHDVTRAMINLAKKEGATSASVLKGLHEEFPGLPKKQMGKLVQKAYVQIAKAQPK